MPTIEFSRFLDAKYGLNGGYIMNGYYTPEKEVLVLINYFAKKSGETDEAIMIVSGPGKGAVYAYLGNLRNNMAKDLCKKVLTNIWTVFINHLRKIHCLFFPVLVDCKQI